MGNVCDSECWGGSKEQEQEQDERARDYCAPTEPKTGTITKLKIILLGDSGVGKTSLINQYIYKKFPSKPTDFKDVVIKELELEGNHVMLEIQDTRGQERLGPGGFEASFFNNAKGCLLVYDVNDPKSFDNLDNWHNLVITRMISNSAHRKSFPFIVLGNKTDLDGGKNKEAYHERARNWCGSNGIHNMFTSAKNHKEVTEAFQYIVDLALDQEMENSKVSTKGQKIPGEEPQSIPSNIAPTINTSLMSGPQKQDAYQSKPKNQPFNIPSNGLPLTSFMSVYSRNPMNQLGTDTSPSNSPPYGHQNIPLNMPLHSPFINLSNK